MLLHFGLQVLQLPIVKNRLKKLLQGAVKKILANGAPVIPSSEDTLEQFLQQAGKFFGKDPTKWEQMGEWGACRWQRREGMRHAAYSYMGRLQTHQLMCWLTAPPGEPTVDVTEDAGKRYIRSTGVFSGVELHLFLEVSSGVAARRLWHMQLSLLPAEGLLEGKKGLRIQCVRLQASPSSMQGLPSLQATMRSNTAACHQRLRRVPACA